MYLVIIILLSLHT